MSKISLNDVRTLNSALVRDRPLVAVFFGGTGGISRATLRELAKAEAKTGRSLRAYIIARNVKAGDDLLQECREIHPDGQFRFIKAENLSLLQDIDRICAVLTQMEEKAGGTDARIDYLMMSQGGSFFNPRIDTPEGIDQAMSLLYYSRMKAIINLLPLLIKSNLPASIVSVYAAGWEAKFFPDDLSLRQPTRFTYPLARSHMVHMYTLCFEALAAQHAGKLRLAHVFPGLVLGPAFQNPELPAWFRLTMRVLGPIFGPLVSVPPEECGERMVSYASTHYPARAVDGDTTPDDACLGTDGKAGSGAYAIGAKGETVVKMEAYTKFDKEDMRTRVWKHTMDAFSVIASGNKFTE